MKTTSPARRWEGAWDGIGAAVFYTLLTLLMTFPLVMRMGSQVVGEIGDNIYFVFLIAWYQKAWFTLGISPFFHPWLNYPQGWNLASTDTSLATTLWGLPVGAVFGATAGYNFAMLLTFVFSGLAMYGWVRRLTDNRAAALIAGMIYAFLPYRMAHFLIGHLNLSGTAWFPLYFMGLYDLLRAEQRWPWRAMLIAAVSLGLIGFTSMYYLYMVMIISAVFVAAYLLWGPARAWRNGYMWQRLIALGLLSLPLIVLAALPFMDLSRTGGLASRSVAYASMYSASPTDFLLPSTDHFLWGRWIGDHFDRSLWIEATLYVGVVALGLALWAWRQRTQTNHRALMRAAWVVIVVAFVLALGTDFHWLGQRVEITLPGFLQTLLHRETSPIPLPALVLFQYLPFYAKMRALMRMGFFVLLFLTMLAGLGADVLLRRLAPRRQFLAAVLLLALVFVDFYPGPYTHFDTVAARPVDSWLAAQPGQGAVAQFPFIQAEDQDQVYNTLTHGKPFIGGFFSANQPEQYLRIKPVLDAFPSAAAVELLRTLGVQWVLVDVDQYPAFAETRVQLETFGLRYRETMGGQAIFELDKMP